MDFVRRDPEKGYIDCALYVPKSAVNVEGVKNALTHFISDKKGDTRVLELYGETDDHLIVPRAFWKPEAFDFEVVDCRPAEFPHVDITSHITLDMKNPSKTTQRDAVAAILASTGGILQLACGKGKTVVALEVASRLKVPTLIVVGDTGLMEQWKGEIQRHLDVPGGIGLIQESVFDWKKPIVLSTYQTLANRAATLPEEVRRWFGLIIPDEAHHVAAPTFCRMADLFYGMRLALTATPERTDGAHVIYDAHIGGVIYKDLMQDLKPHFEFIWTGLSLDINDPTVNAAVVDSTGEMHLSKLASYFAQWKPRLEKILAKVREHEAQGRKTIVLSTTVAELVNLLALYNGVQDLYTDIPVPQPKEFNSSLTPCRLKRESRERFLLELQRAKVALMGKTLNATKKEQIKKKLIPHIEKKLEQDELARKLDLELEHRQKAYIKKLLAMQSTAGLMIRHVKPAERIQMLKEKKTIFAVYHYGLEGLDDSNLDTAIACEPMTSKNAIQQFVGRILRKGSSNSRVVQFIEDDVGPITGMCMNVRKVLREWPTDEGGPYEYDLIDHPATMRRIKWLNSKNRTLGRSSFPVADPTSGGK